VVGGVVRRVPRAERGVVDVFLTDAGRRDPLFSSLLPRFPVFKSHENVLTLPPGAVPLAGSIACEHEAFRWGATAYGVHFHVELRPRHLRWRLRPTCDRSLTAADRAGDALEAALEAAAPQLQDTARTLLDRWLLLAGVASGSRAGAAIALSR
jgi:GMP synthase (glutamine-hydrolysing)